MTEREVTVTVKVAGLPPRQHGRMITDWSVVAEVLRSQPNQWVLVPDFEDTPRARAIAASVAGKRPPVPLRELGGKVSVSVRNSTIVEGRTVGSAYLMWIPEPKAQ